MATWWPRHSPQPLHLALERGNIAHCICGEASARRGGVLHSCLQQPRHLEDALIAHSLQSVTLAGNFLRVAYG